MQTTESQAMKDGSQAGEPTDSNAFLEMSLKVANIYAARGDLESAAAGFRYGTKTAATRVLEDLHEPQQKEHVPLEAVVRRITQIFQPLSAPPPGVDLDLLGLLGISADALAKFMYVHCWPHI